MAKRVKVVRPRQQTSQDPGNSSPHPHISFRQPTPAPVPADTAAEEAEEPDGETRRQQLMAQLREVELAIARRQAEKTP